MKTLEKAFFVCLGVLFVGFMCFVSYSFGDKIGREDGYNTAKGEFDRIRYTEQNKTMQKFIDMMKKEHNKFSDKKNLID